MAGIRPPPGHPGRASQELGPGAADRDGDPGRGLLPFPPGLQYCVLPGSGHFSWGVAVGGGTGCEGAARWMEC